MPQKPRKSRAIGISSLNQCSGHSQPGRGKNASKADLSLLTGLSEIPSLKPNEIEGVLSGQVPNTGTHSGLQSKEPVFPPPADEDAVAHFDSTLNVFSNGQNTTNQVFDSVNPYQPASENPLYLFGYPYTSAQEYPSSADFKQNEPFDNGATNYSQQHSLPQDGYEQNALSHVYPWYPYHLENCSDSSWAGVCNQQINSASSYTYPAQGIQPVTSFHYNYKTQSQEYEASISNPYTCYSSCVEEKSYDSVCSNYSAVYPDSGVGELFSTASPAPNPLLASIYGSEGGTRH
ncbi:unnamed protein product [Protopolystoma xenopodis]|uniref:Uncharacterized protein n=1 Tax=Protopolystoma xenopodis TaxID=117903 RepID=A0A3S5BX26_9PLAT|nr:unnamed protein product [Protopolystoma xenopodis]